jgi:penicillin G amidase
MKIVLFLIFSLLTVLLIVCLNTQWGSTPPLGKLLSPQHGFWQNAEAVEKDFGEDLELPGLKEGAEVYLDDRMVPHVFAKTDADAFYMQGYLHARFRLWQMEFQTYAAAGRLSELIGPKALNYDREKRRLGMVYAAEIAAREIEKDSTTKMEADAYTAGVNAYIDNLRESQLPIEYKLLNYKPERWTNLKTCLFLKFMSLDLAGAEHDFEYSSLRSALGYETFAKMFPVTQDSLDPVVPKDTALEALSTTIKAPANSDSVYLNGHDSAITTASHPDPDNGSNNWVVSGKKTKSGAPILCNDPHLGLNLPALWFEMQLSTPAFNVYGATFPGAPGIIIGFNDSCAFGFTNAMRDVRDYYQIRFRDDNKKEYWFNGQWKEASFRYEHILQRGAPEFIDTVAYTIFGPVMFDKNFSGNRKTNGNYYSVRWKAHDPSNELRIFNDLDHAKNYSDYQEAVQWLHTPGQNCVFACKNGDIAIVDQGEFPAKWKRQGDFVMEGTDSQYMWQGMIPQSQNPAQFNPERGFVSSGNQLPVNPLTYPYYLGVGSQYLLYRGITINRYLSQLKEITPEDMMKLQTDNYNIFAEMARPVLLKNMDVSALNESEKQYFDLLQSWDLRNEAESKGTTIFILTWDSLTKIVWDDELGKAGVPDTYPAASTLLEGILKDSAAYEFLDNVNTPQKETLQQDVTEAFKRAVAVCKKEESDGMLIWGKHKATHINHLARLPAFSRTEVFTGGGLNCINATKEDHGPSWRMIVQLTANTEAYGIYPGGQSGNPGSIYYDDFVDNWATGKYYPLWVMKKEESGDKRVLGKITAVPAKINL